MREREGGEREGRREGRRREGRGKGGSRCVCFVCVSHNNTVTKPTTLQSKHSAIIVIVLTGSSPVIA